MERKDGIGKVHGLTDELSSLMMEHGYSPRTLIPYQRVWRFIAEYADGHGQLTADAQWIIPLVSEYSGIQGGQTTTASQRRALFAGRRLCDYQTFKATGIAPRWMPWAQPQSRICILAEEAERYLLAKSYSKSGIRHLRHVWHRLADYAYQHNYVEIKDGWVLSFLLKQYQISGSALTATQKTYRRAAFMLRDFQQLSYISCGGRITRKTERTDCPCVFIIVTKCCNEKGLSASTQRYYRHRGRHFASSLSERVMGLDRAIRCRSSNAASIYDDRGLFVL